jgi:hypothetical protein
VTPLLRLLLSIVALGGWLFLLLLGLVPPLLAHLLLVAALALFPWRLLRADTSSH